MKKMSKKEKIYIIVCLLLMVLSVSSYFILTSIWNKEVEEAQKKLDETIEKYGTIEEETVENIVAKFNAEVLANGKLNVASEEYLTKEEDNTYWYGLEQGLYLMIEPMEYKGDKKEEKTAYMILYVDNAFTDYEKENEYSKCLVKANNSEFSDKEVLELLKGSLELASESKCANNGKGISVCHLTQDDHRETQIKRLYK